MTLAIEFNQIHRVVRTYQQAIHRLPSARQDDEQAGYVEDDQISISPDARKRDLVHLKGDGYLAIN